MAVDEREVQSFHVLRMGWLRLNVQQLQLPVHSGLMRAPFAVLRLWAVIGLVVDAVPDGASAFAGILVVECKMTETETKTQHAL